MEGFDMRHSRGGRWGSVILHPLHNMLTGFCILCANGLKEVIIAKVVLGDLYDSGMKVYHSHL